MKLPPSDVRPLRELPREKTAAIDDFCRRATAYVPEFLRMGLAFDPLRPSDRPIGHRLERRGMRVTRIPTRKGLAIVVDPARRPEVAAGMSVVACDPEAGSGWWETDLEAWQVFFSHREGAARVLEIGSGNGSSATRLLDLVFTHPESEVHCIDLYEGTAGEEAHSAFLSRAAQGGQAERLHWYEGLSREVLAWMIAGDGYWQGFDFVHLATPTEGSELLGDACQAWEMLKPGGVMVFGPGAIRARDAFLAVFGDRLDVILQGERAAVLKRR